MADGLLIIILVHGAVDALEAERGDEFGGHFEPFLNLRFLVVGPFAEHEIDLCAARIFVADAETHACVRVRS